MAHSVYLTSVINGVRTFRPTDSSPHGRFAPCMDILLHGRFPTGISHHRCTHTRHFTPWAICL